MKKITALVLAVMILTGCQGPAKPAPTPAKSEKTVYAMDTVMTLTAYGENGADGLSRAEAEILRLEDLLSISKETSDIYRRNLDPSAAISTETSGLLARAADITRITGGDFDPAVAPLMDLWGFRTKDYHVPSQTELNEALAHMGNGGIDLGGIAKGYTSERALSELEDAGVSSAIVSLGGNVGALGLKPDGSRWTVAIQDPEGDGYIATLELGEDGEKIYAITSGGYQRYFEQDGTRYHHILDPKTGAPAETDLLSVTIVSQDGTLADGLSTALFVKGFDEAVEFWREYHTQFGMVLVTEDGLFATEELSVSSELTVQPLEVTP